MFILLNVWRRNWTKQSVTAVTDLQLQLRSVTISPAMMPKEQPHYSIQINHQPDVTILQFINLTFLQLNMFRAFSRPSSGAQWQPLFLTSYRGDSRAVFVVGPVMSHTSAALHGCVCRISTGTRNPWLFSVALGVVQLLGNGFFLPDLYQFIIQSCSTPDTTQ